MSERCASCGAPKKISEALFCPYCGAEYPFNGVRLGEALAIETVGDSASPLLPYGTLLPASIRTTFSTAEDDQPAIAIHVVVGNHEQASHNRTVAKLAMLITKTGKKGEPSVVLTLSVDESGYLKIGVIEQGTENRFESEELRVAVIKPAV